MTNLVLQPIKLGERVLPECLKMLISVKLTKDTCMTKTRVRIFVVSLTLNEVVLQFNLNISAVGTN